jgi:23S rRNA pseudouridine2605 synthase
MSRTPHATPRRRPRAVAALPAPGSTGADAALAADLVLAAELAPAAEPVPAAELRGVRIHKAMAQAGVASRREAERMIADGRVRVNGREVLRPGGVLHSGDTLEVGGRPVSWEQRGPHELWALYKPKRCMCTLNDPEGRSTVKDFFPQSRSRLFPIGRLDYDAEGLLLLTNDGELAQRVAHPSFGVPRLYLVKVRGTVQADTVRRLNQGIVLEGRVRKPAHVRVLHTVNDKTWLEVVLREGIQHHIKRMFQAVEHPVLKIKRYQIGTVELGDLRPGQSRKLGRADIERLMRGASGPEAARRRPPAEGGPAAPRERLPRLSLPLAELGEP